MRSTLQLFILLLTLQQAYGQTWDVQVSGTVLDVEEQRKLPDIRVVLMKNDDTLAVTHTNADGAFDITTTFSVADSYAIFLDVEHQNKKHDWIKLHVKGDTSQVSDYYMELGKLRVIHDRFDTGTYYELNETVEHTDFDFSFLQSMVDEYPQLCIRFVQTIHPEETLKTANKRKRHFLKELKAAGVNMDQVLFSEEVFRSDADSPDDRRSRIEGVVHSMDGNCK